MKRQFFTLFLSLLLSGCSGGSRGSSSKKPQSCAIANGSGHKIWDKIAKKYSSTCTVSTCNAGFDNDEDATECQTTMANYYSPANDKTRKTCPTPSHSSPTVNTELSSADGCYNCDGGYLKNTAGNTCDVPSKGTYVNAGGTEASCNPIALQGAATSTWIAGAAETAATCPFSCNAGFVKSGRACNIPDQGKYADGAGAMQSCNTPTGATGGFNTFLENRGAVETATDCDFSCNAGFVKIGRKCNYPTLGNYVNNQGTEASCNSNSIALQGAATSTWIVGAAETAATCPFSCSAGFVKSGRACNTPGLGKYADGAGAMQSCNTPTGAAGGFNTFLPNRGAVETATDCGFSCNVGFLKDSSARACNFPSTGNYVTAGGTESSCTDITGMTGFGSWLSGAATDADSCPFSCSSGYTVSGRTCRKPEMLALGLDTSRILFSTGEVEAWGDVSASFWRSHIKENLGSNTPQALVSGYYHQCIILNNAALNHGSLMCWGQNGKGVLGVGDNNPRNTPTAVTVAFLGNAGDGTPKTVKSVAIGLWHTCALLNDNTVVCWGDSTYGQIGGGIPGANKTISGTLGEPLGSGSAGPIAAGEGHSCAVLSSDNSVKCWGYNYNGQTGGGTPNLGVNKTATEIAAGGTFSCAILNDGSVACWGGTASPSLGGKTATGITAGSSYSCVLLTDKTVKCWGGNNDKAQIGGGTAGSHQVLRGTLGDPLGGQTAIQVETGYNHTCAIMESDNSVKCWGRNIDNNGNGFYGQIVGEVPMTGGSDGMGTSTGETATLTATSIPTATALEADARGKVCALTLSEGNLSDPWVVKNYTTPLTYNGRGSTTISAAIDNLIATIGSPVNLATTDVTLSKQGNKIEATVNSAVFDGMTLTIYHDDNGGDCTTGTVVTSAIPLAGGSGAAGAEGLWVISNDFTGSGDKTINLDSVHIDLGTSSLTKEGIARKIVSEVSDVNWAGKQYKDLPYTTTILNGSSNAGDDCPANDFCVAFWRVFKGTEGNYGIPFGDRDYEH